MALLTELRAFVLCIEAEGIMLTQYASYGG